MKAKFWRVVPAALFVLMATVPLYSAAQGFPNRPVRFVVPYPPGGPLDVVARALGDKMSAGLKQPVIIDNKPGAGGNLGADFVAKSPADGYTIVMGAVATHAINPALYAKMPYDPVRDFQPVSLVASVPNVLVVGPNTQPRSVKDLIAYARAHPGKLNFGSGSNGSAGHLAGEMFKQMTGTYMVHIPYAGANPAMLALLSGQTDLMFDNLANALVQVKSGKLAALAVTTRKRSSFAPELPTLEEADAQLKGFDIDTWFGVLAPAGIPADALAALHDQLIRALGEPDVKERLAKFGAEPGGDTPAQFAAFIKTEIPKYARIVKASGARVD
ncbi:MAG: transporter substrate-binding protein [Betaproteobacteria bacterium]|nr:transporter substrate-binding protein [Betaproteobacteria bacterium]